MQFITRNGASTLSAAVITENAWNHVAASGDGAGNLRVFANGAVVGTGTISAYTKQNGGNWLWGEQNKQVDPTTFARNFIGNMKCMRITKHVRWTAAFTPPTSLVEYS